LKAGPLPKDFKCEKFDDLIQAILNLISILVDSGTRDTLVSFAKEIHNILIDLAQL